MVVRKEIHDVIFEVKFLVYFYIKIIFSMSSGQYFPKAYDDIVSVWEDESIAFDALANDYYAGDQANLVEFSNVSS